jgi:hypothetical protein
MLPNDGSAAVPGLHADAATGLAAPSTAHPAGPTVRRRSRLLVPFRLVTLSADDRLAVGLWAAAHLALLVLAWAAAWVYRSTQDHAPLTGSFEHWDAVLLRNIAQYGYFGPHTIPNNVAFLPGYPAVLAVGHLLLRNWVLAELVVSGLAGCVAVVAITRLAAGKRAVLYLLAAPGVVFLMVGYTEALFLALAIPAWLAAARGQWWRAALLAGLAGLVRPDGLFLIPALAVMALSGYRGPGTWPPPAATVAARLANAAKVCCALAGPASYEVYLWAATGNPTAWQAANRKGWDLHFTTPFQDLRTTWWAAFRHPFGAGTAFEFQFSIAALVVMGVAALAFLAAGRWPQATYCLVALAAVGTTTWFDTGARTLLVQFPIWVGLAALEVRQSWIRYAYLAISGPLAVVLGLMYLSGQWAG